MAQFRHTSQLMAACFGLAVAVCAGGAVAAPETVSFNSLDGTVLKALVFHPPSSTASTTHTTIQATRGTVIALHGCDGLYADFDARNGQLNTRHQAMADMLVADGYTGVPRQPYAAW